MTDKIRGSIGPDGPPWPEDLLADLHAGVLEPRRAAVVQADVGADADARAFLAALDAVRTDLSALGAAPVPPMPENVAARIDAALAEEAARAFGAPGTPASGIPVAPSSTSLKATGSLADDDPEPAPVIDMAAARRKRGRMAVWGAGLLTAAAAAVAFVVVPGLGGQDDTDGGMAAEQPSPTVSAPGDAGAQPPLAFGREEVGEKVPQVVNSRDYGPLKTKAGLDSCLEANELDPAKAQVVGVRPVTLDGKDGVMALLLTQQVGQFQVLVLTPDCTALFNDTIG
ncbi:hypothetical protein ACFPM7_00625 [Actinokineospora guangxiensis]|uniref:Uncharacterized protein n=1 Tax=Actinokineospora guangxiensis TaxID=1490288 RepID=A0ABW0EH36_9PSEU